MPGFVVVIFGVEFVVEPDRAPNSDRRDRPLFKLIGTSDTRLRRGDFCPCRSRSCMCFSYDSQTLEP